MIEGFTARKITAGNVSLHTVLGGNGPPLLLMHGYPQTHLLWRHVAPVLAGHFTIVAPDLRGYGESDKPPAGSDFAAYSKRVMAADMVALMTALGFETFAVAGHDRGGRVAYRLALDHPERVTGLATLDIMPTLDTWESLTGTRGLAAWHWYFLAQPPGVPEPMIAADPEAFLERLMGSWLLRRDAIDATTWAAYASAFRDPETIRATCDDYRAGASVDVAIDRADREAGRRIRCPLLALWGDRDGALADDRYLQVWKRWADDARGGPIPGGHFLPEEAPEETSNALLAFFCGLPEG